jgi:hypothetical protein
LIRGKKRITGKVEGVQQRQGNLYWSVSARLLPWTFFEPGQMLSISKPQVESYDNISYDLHSSERKWMLKG